MTNEQPSPQTLIRHIGQLVTVAQQPLTVAHGPLQIISDAALAVAHGRIQWIGLDSEVEQRFNLQSSHPNQPVIIDAENSVISPGLVDSHTHLVFAGDRAAEFHLRRQGVSYGELLAQGFGIITTMRATRAASTETLMSLARTRLQSMAHYGTTTVEAKTGYGLDFASEERCLQLMQDLNGSSTIRVVPTFLGAHSIPPEYRARRTAYVDLIVEEMLPAFAPLARFCDVYCERETFTVQESHGILSRAQALGYRLKIHADQLSPSGGTRLAAEMHAVSADHLDFASNDDLAALRDANVIATLLPGCSYTLRTPYPSARRLLDHGLKVALATDFNPGTSYSENLQMTLGLAMSAMGMTLDEALTAITIRGAQALALDDQIGSIEVGKRCELTQWHVHDYQEIGYHFGTNLVKNTLVIP